MLMVFKATKSLYFGLYLALALLSVVLGVTFRQEHALAHSTSFQNLEVILMIVYVSVILAIAVLCFVNVTSQNFAPSSPYSIPHSCFQLFQSTMPKVSWSITPSSAFIRNCWAGKAT